MQSDQDQTRLGLAALAACIVQTLDESDPGFQDRFQENLARAYDKLRDAEPDWTGSMEMLAWTRDLLKK